MVWLALSHLGPCPFCFWYHLSASLWGLWAASLPNSAPQVGTCVLAVQGVGLLAVCGLPVCRGVPAALLGHLTAVGIRPGRLPALCLSWGPFAPMSGLHVCTPTCTHFICILPWSCALALWHGRQPPWLVHSRDMQLHSSPCCCSCSAWLIHSSCHLAKVFVVLLLVLEISLPACKSSP